jgi:3-hydroxyisobutyrate dehydrogenase-like beta-hydroxyacid dehydrogenase
VNAGHFAFIGLGVMGEPMCRHLALKSGRPVVAYDLDRTPLDRLAAHGVSAAGSVRAAAERAPAVFLSLPSGEVVERVVDAPDGLYAALGEGQIVIDLGTSPVDTTRRLAARCAARGATWVDAPVARTRAAAEAGALSVTVGAAPEVFERVRPWLSAFASDVTLCGPVGCGQVTKILNNMVLFQTVAALAEARAIAQRAGMDPGLLFDALSKGSADSFALRNHGAKAILPGEFPARAFSVDYARKDLSYALRLAREGGVRADGALRVDRLFEKARERGYADLYWPVVSRLFDPEDAA